MKIKGDERKIEIGVVNNKKMEIEDEVELPDIITKPYVPCEPTNNTNVFCEFGRKGGIFIPNVLERDLVDFFSGKESLKPFYSAETKNFVHQFGTAGVVHTNEKLSFQMPRWITGYNHRILTDGNKFTLSNRVWNELKYFQSENYLEGGYIPPSILEEHLWEESRKHLEKLSSDVYQGNIIDGFKNGNQNYLCYVRGPTRNHLAVGNISNYTGKKVQADCTFEFEETILRVRNEGEICENQNIRIGANSLYRINVLNVSLEDQVRVELTHSATFNSPVMDFRFPTQNRYFKEDEVVVACFDGSVYLMDLNGEGELIRLKAHDLGVEYSGKDDLSDWKGIEYASSPLTVYLAYNDKVFLIDRRVSFHLLFLNFRYSLFKRQKSL